MVSLSKDSRIAENSHFLKSQLVDAARASGRDSGSVALLAVTKTQDWTSVFEALSAGITHIGENRLQEAMQKIPHAIAVEHPAVKLHFIGHLQKNKVRKALGLFDCIQSVDDVETLTLLASEARRIEKTISVLFEVNTSGEESKNGVRREDELFALLEAAQGLTNIRPEGLMTIGPLGEDEKRIRTAFASLRSLSEKCRTRFSPSDWGTLSMGMSGDWPWAVAEGSTMVRIGTALFGPRLSVSSTVGPT